MSHANRWRALDGLWVGLLALFIAAGTRSVPFHGDESTINMMSRDWHTILIGRVADLFYRDPPLDDPARQELRLLNGTLTGFGIGLVWSNTGFQAADLSAQWDWGADFAYNRDNGHMPGPAMLLVSRLWGVWCSGLSVALVFATARCLLNRPGAWIAAFIYATLPVVALNGRRISFEGASLLTETLLVFVTVRMVQYITRGVITPRHWLWFGAACGLALAAKHNLLIVVAAAGISVMATGRFTHRARHMAGGLALAVIVALAVFLALNPAWWSAPLPVAREVLRLRVDLLNGQAQAFGSYPPTADGLIQRITALATFPLGAPQYYEAGDQWATWIGDQIRGYESGWFGPIPLQGIGLPSWTLVFPLIGLFTLPRRALQYTIRLMAAGVAAALFVLTPVPWQRYYLPLAPFWAILYAAGIAAGAAFVARYARRSPRVEQS